MIKKTACFTIDIEPDFGGKGNSDAYFGLKDLPRLEELVKKYDLKITAFVTGKTFEDNDGLLDILKSMKFEIEQHSYSHRIGKGSKIDDIKKGLEVHEKITGKSPLGYRAPQGEITKEEALFLVENGILFDSSIFPTFFPGRYNRLSFPTYPFKLGETNLMEIPFSVIPKIRIPVGFSYIRLFGLNTFKFLFKIFGMPNLMIIDFHSYEFGRPPSYYDTPTFTKIVHYRGQHMHKDKILLFEDFIKYILSNGYQSKYMLDVYNEIKSNVQRWEWSPN